jgi:hypothetical protein
MLGNVLSLIALRFVHAPSLPTENRFSGYSTTRTRRSLAERKFRTVDRQVQFDPGKYGWSWFPDTASWVIPTAFRSSLSNIARLLSHEAGRGSNSIGNGDASRSGCPGGGWNAGNGMVFSAPLKPHIDTTAIALLA